MFQNFIKIAVRNLLRHKGYSFINIFGLAMGMAASLLIFLYVRDERGYDSFHKDSERVYRVVKDFINDDGSRIPDATSPAALAPAMQKQLPEVETITRVNPDWGGTWLVRYGDKKLTEHKVYRVDSSFFDVFTFPFVKGDPKTALQDVSSVIITESVAERYFGKEDPMGKTLSISNVGESKVTGVIKDVPANSHFHFDFLMSFNQLGSLNENWGRYNYYTYAKLKPGANIPAFNKKIQDLYLKSQDEKFSDFYTQPLRDIHLDSHLKWELEPNGDRLYVNVFSVIGLFILLIAAINYINLSTAKSALRAKEIGIRKVSGAVRYSLLQQFLFESVMTSLLAAVLAVILAQLLTPVVNDLTAKELTVIGKPSVPVITLLAAIPVGLLAGLLPALYLSSFRPIMVLKGFKMNDRGALNLRKSLVVVQFTISIVLIIGALIITQQIRFIQNAKLGFDKDQVLIINNAGPLSVAQRSAMLNTIRNIPGIKKAATSNLVLGAGFSTSRMKPKGATQEQQVNFTSVGYNYLDVVGIEMKEGHDFTPEFASDTITNGIPGGPLEQTIGGIILNEKAVKDLGLGSSPLGKQLEWGRDADTVYYVKVVGVTKDFHFTSLRNEIKPFAFISRPSQQGNFTLKLSGNIPDIINRLQAEWKKLNTERPFEYAFLDESFSKLYTSEGRFQKVFISLVVLGILISCLGLLGLATYAAEQRVKEIGIRKTLGASAASVVALLSKDFLKLVIVSLVLSIPIAWYMMYKWLSDFAYRVDIKWWVFVAAGVVALLIAFLTISVQTLRAAMANPVKSLRAE